MIHSMAKAKAYKNKKGIMLYLSGNDLEGFKINHLDTLFVWVENDGHDLRMRLEKDVKP